MIDYSTANRQAAKIALLFLIISAAWIAAGDRLIFLLPDELYGKFSTYESWLIIFVAAGFIYFTVKSGYRSFIRNREKHLHEFGRNLKNDLTALAGVTDLHIRQLNNRGSAAALESTRFRINTLSEIYELLLTKGSGRSISFRQVTDYMKTSNFNGLNLHCDELHLPLDQTVTLGLLLNEVIAPFVRDRQGEEYPVSVAIKNGQGSAVSVIFRLVEASEYRIARLQNNENSLEGRLIQTFTKKLQGASSWKRTNGHVRYQIQFHNAGCG